MKIRTKMILMVSSIIIIITFFSTAVSLITNYKSSQSLIDNFIPKVVNSTSQAVSNKIDIYLTNINGLSRNSVLSDSLSSNNEKLSALSSIKQDTFIYMGYYDKNKNLVSTNNGVEPPNLTFYDKSINGESYFSEPFVGEDGKTLFGLASSPVKDKQGNISGVLFGVFDFTEICDLVKNTSVSENTSPTIYNQDGVLMAYWDAQFIIDGYNLYTQWLDLLKNDTTVRPAYERALSGSTGFEYLNVDGQKIVFGYAPVKNTTWSYNFYVPMSDFMSSFYTSLFINIATSLIFIIIGSIIVFIYGNKLTKPITYICERMVSLAKGDLKTEVKVFKTKDELEDLSISLENVVKSSKEQAVAMEEIASGNYSVKVKERSEFDITSKSMNKMIEGQNHAIHNISSVMSRISNGDLSSSIDDDFIGDLAPIKESINNTIKILGTYINETSRILDLLSNGMLSENIEIDFIGDFNKLKESINHMIVTQRGYISNISYVMKQLQKGNLSVNVDIDYNGDYAPIKESINNTVLTLKEYINEIKRVLASIEQGDLTDEISINFVGDFNILKESISGILMSLNEILSNINSAADQVAIGADQIAIGSQNLSQGTIKQAGTIEELSATTAEISSKVEINAEKAVSAMKISDDALNEVEVGNEKMQSMIEAMENISTSSSEIGKIIKTISDISFQTNILSLNAAVEAARAGEAGKAFSVVAMEVQNLASKSAEASKSITELIENSVSAVKNGEQIAQYTARSLDQIVDITKNSASLIQDIATATQEQALSSQQISEGLEQISEVVQTNSATSQESAASSEQLSSQAQTLKELINKFKLK